MARKGVARRGTAARGEGYNVARWGFGVPTSVRSTKQGIDGSGVERLGGARIGMATQGDARSFTKRVNIMAVVKVVKPSDVIERDVVLKGVGDTMFARYAIYGASFDPSMPNPKFYPKRLGYCNVAGSGSWLLFAGSIQ